MHDSLFDDECTETPKERLFRRDRPSLHYTGHFETRVVIDPLWYHLERPDHSALELQHLVRYSEQVTTPVGIELLYPRYLEPPGTRRAFGAWFHDPAPREIAPPVERSLPSCAVEAIASARAAYGRFMAEIASRGGGVDRDNPSEVDRAVYGKLAFERPEGLDLLQLAHDHGADHVLTSNPWLLDVADTLRAKGLFIAGAEAMLERLQLSLRAAGVFIEVVRPQSDQNVGLLGRLRVPMVGLGFSNFYQMETADGFAAFVWFDRVLRHYPDGRVLGYARAAMLHRLPFLLYAQDLIRFHAETAQLQQNNHDKSHHRFHVAYHLNAFYVNLAALLDNVAWLWNYALALGFHERSRPKKTARTNCGLGKQAYRRALGSRHPALSSLVEDAEFQDWIAHLPIKRDPAAHREPLFLSEIREEGTERLISDSALVFEADDGKRALDLLWSVKADLARLRAFLTAMLALPFPEPQAGARPQGIPSPTASLGAAQGPPRV